LALSQHAMPPVFQVASICGIAGVTFILVACNVGVASLLGSSFRLVPGSRPTRAAITGIALAVAAVRWGVVRLSVSRPALRGPEVVAVDGDATEQAASTLDRYLAASEAAAAARPRLLVWPESALTVDIEHDRAAWSTLEGFLEGHGVALLAGGPGIERRS